MAQSTTKSRFDDPAAHTFFARLATGWITLKYLVRDHLQLALLEVQRASLSFAKIVAAAVVIAVLVVSAWMGALAAVIGWIVGEGASWPLAIFLGAVVNLIAAAALAWWIKSTLPELLFAATLRQLRADKDGAVYADRSPEEAAVGEPLRGAP
ncbi:MAG TPA: phage holin family protein [Casimicrobiaceae bacterium]|nr:phage holin family protein [Casimicrobiaceae bacterium]